MNYPSPRWLFQFQFLVRTGSFTEAAARMQMSQQALSKNIQALEAWAGHTLLQRQPLGPTHEGERLLDALPALLHGLQQLGRGRPRKSGRLALGISEALPLALLTPALQQGLAADTDCELQSLGLPETDIQVYLQAGELELGLSLRPLAGPGLESRQAVSLEWGYVAAPAVLEQGLPYPMLRRGPNVADAAAQEPELAAWTRLVGEFPHWELIKVMCLEQAGVACLPIPYVAEELAAGRLQRCPEPFATFHTPLYFTAAPAQHERVLVQQLREQVGR